MDSNRSLSWARRIAVVALLVALYAAWQARDLAQGVNRLEWGKIITAIMMGLSGPTALEQANRLAEQAAALREAGKELQAVRARLAAAKSSADLLEKRVTALEQARSR